MYVLKISDVIFFINSVKNPTSSFNINSFVSFSNSSTRPAGLELRHNTSFTNKQRHFYFNQICKLWNAHALPIINMDLSTSTIKNKLAKIIFSGNTLLTISFPLIYINFIICVPAVPVYIIPVPMLIIFNPSPQ